MQFTSTWSYSWRYTIIFILNINPEAEIKEFEPRLKYVFFIFTFYLILENMSTNGKKVVFLVIFDTCDVMYNWSVSLLPPIVIDNLFAWHMFCIIFQELIKNVKLFWFVAQIKKSHRLLNMSCTVSVTPPPPHPHAIRIQKNAKNLFKCFY